MSNKQVIHKIRKAANLGYAEAQYQLGCMYANGYNIPRDAIKAVDWYYKAAMQGHAEAQYNMGVMCSNVYPHVRLDDKQVAHWYRKAADQGHAEAQYQLGCMYANGKGRVEESLDWGFPKNYEQALY